MKKEIRQSRAKRRTAERDVTVTQLPTSAQFQSIRRCLHPDSRKSVSDEVLGRAYLLFMDMEFALTGKRTAVVQPLRPGEPMTSLTVMYRRGWTRALVDDLLGKPDRLVRAVPSGRPVPRYRLARVEAAEAGDEFKRGRRQPPRRIA